MNTSAKIITLAVAFSLMLFVFLAVYILPGYILRGADNNNENPVFTGYITANATAAIKSAESLGPAVLDNSIQYEPVVSEYSLEIPTLNIKAPVILEASPFESKIYKALEKGVVRFSGTADPGEPGISIILGHSSSYPWYSGNYGEVFKNLYKLQNGNLIRIIKDGKILSFKVTDSVLVNDATDARLAEFETSGGSSIILMTCWPTGSASKRIAVKADMI